MKYLPCARYNIKGLNKIPYLVSQLLYYIGFIGPILQMRILKPGEESDSPRVTLSTYLSSQSFPFRWILTED